MHLNGSIIKWPLSPYLVLTTDGRSGVYFGCSSISHNSRQLPGNQPPAHSTGVATDTQSRFYSNKARPRKKNNNNNKLKLLF